MNNKIYNILFESKLNPGRMGLLSLPASDSEQALQNGLAYINKQLGDFGWVPKLTTIVMIDTYQPPVVADAPVGVSMEVDKDKNFFLKTILDNKDEKLLESSKAYLTENEIKYIKNKWESK